MEEKEMKKFEVEIGINYKNIPQGHRPSTVQLYAGASCEIVGGYGISINRRYFILAKVTVEIPDWCVPSKEWRWELSRPGYHSTCGTDDLCFVTCNKIASTGELIGIGSLNPDGQKALIMEAVNSGLTFHFPGENGKMEKMALEPLSIRWISAN